MLIFITGIPSTTPFLLLLYAIAGILQAAVRQLTYIGIEKIGVARSGPIRASVHFWSVDIAIFFLGETITAPIDAGTVLVVGGILLARRRACRDRRWYVVALLAAILGGVVIR
jgi:drug/metabolite transporter (DMT)-like permease